MRKRESTNKSTWIKGGAALLAAALFAGSMTGCANQQAPAAKVTAAAATTSATTSEKQTEAVRESAEKTVPKYVFLFIGDGMSYTQIQAAAYYQGAVGSGGGVATKKLSFMDFPVAGTAQTYDSTSFAPDSASTATSIATGNKTYSGTINMDTTFTVAFETIAEKLKHQKDYQIGIVSSVNLNHATPAAFYAHQVSRNSYYDIGLELIDSGFDYFAGGSLLAPDGDGSVENVYNLAEQAGYKIIRTQAEAEAYSRNDGKAILISETVADGGAIPYTLDTVGNEWVLADYVKKGIEVLDNETGFFMMVEGGKIDWAGHANDARSNIADTVALADAVDEAIKFYQNHPDETLILVTGDHETGGMSIGFAGLDYDLYLTNLENQKISYAKYDSDYVAVYKEKNTSFDDAMKDVKALFGLLAPGDVDAAEDSKQVLTAYEYGKLQDAYDRTIAVGGGKKAEMTEAEYILYGTYEPFTVTLTHLLNNKSGIGWTSYAHTGVPVPVFAIGAGQELFEGYYDNTDIYFHVAALTGVK